VVRIRDVQNAGRASFNVALVTAVSFATPFQALLLVALASLSRSTGRESGGFGIQEVLTKMHALAGASGCPAYASPPSFGESIHLLNRIGEVSPYRSTVFGLLLLQGCFVADLYFLFVIL
jgi:hypothetical protein